MPVDAGETQPAAETRGIHFDELGSIAAEQGDGVALLQPPGAQGPDELVGARIQLAVAAVAPLGQDGAPVGRALGGERDEHSGGEGFAGRLEHVVPPARILTRPATGVPG